MPEQAPPSVNTEQAIKNVSQKYDKQSPQLTNLDLWEIECPRYDMCYLDCQWQTDNCHNANWS